MNRREHARPRAARARAASVLLAALALSAALASPSGAAASAASWATLAAAQPGEPQLPWEHYSYAPIVWTPEQVAAMRRRALQQMRAEDGSGGDTAGSLGSTKLPICELNLAYRIVDLTAANFTAVVTLTNNREVGAGRQRQELRRAVLRPPVPFSLSRGAACRRRLPPLRRTTAA